MFDIFVFDLEEIMCTFLGNRKRVQGGFVEI
jgi:hypothetical protein